MYVNRLRSLNKKADIGAETIKYAFLSGLKPALASFVMGRNPKTFAEAVESARVAEFSTLEAARPDENLMQEMTALRNGMQRLAQKCDTVSLNAAIQQERKVSFAEERQRTPSPKRAFDVRGAREKERPPMQSRDRGRESFRGQNRRWNSAQQPRGPRYGQLGQTTQNFGARCNKCSRGQHNNILFCPASNKHCTVCGRFGHFRAVCKLRID